MTILQFTPWSSQVEPAFWHALSQLKIDVLRLSSDSVPISAFYSSSKAFLDRNTNSEIALASPLTLPGDACNAAFAPPSRSHAIKGTLKNFNTTEEFKTADKAALFNHLADQVRISRVYSPIHF
jgi:ubiquitin-like modifier-activating enzyme ATG7